jgi:hypothetical protein
MWAVADGARLERVWVLFNNISMWDDARRFKQLLARSA